MAVDSVEVIAKEPEVFPYDVGFAMLALKNIHVDFTSYGTAQHVSLRLPELRIRAEDIDLKNQVVSLKEVFMENSEIVYQILESDQRRTKSPPVAKNDTVEEKPWKITLGALSLQNNNLQYDDFNAASQQQGMDLSLIHI